MSESSLAPNGSSQRNQRLALVAVVGVAVLGVIAYLLFFSGKSSTSASTRDPASLGLGRVVGEPDRRPGGSGRLHSGGGTQPVPARARAANPGGEPDRQGDDEGERRRPDAHAVPAYRHSDVDARTWPHRLREPGADGDCHRHPVAHVIADRSLTRSR